VSTAVKAVKAVKKATPLKSVKSFLRGRGRKKHDHYPADRFFTAFTAFTAWRDYNLVTNTTAPHTLDDLAFPEIAPEAGQAPPVACRERPAQANVERAHILDFTPIDHQAPSREAGAADPYQSQL
jgi:hypothetical protein